MLGILAKPYPYYIPFKTSFKLILYFSIGFPLFYLLAQPFGINNWQCSYKSWIILGMFFPLLTTLSINFYAVSKISSSLFNEEKWTIGKEIIWSLWNILTIIVSNHYYYIYAAMPVCSTNSDLGMSLIYGLAIGIIPSIFCVQFNLLRSYKNRLNKAEKLSELLSGRQGIIDNEIIELKGENESLKVGLNDLRVVKAEDNYSMLIWKSNGHLDKRLIRGSLKSIEIQLQQNFIKRCHRSYLVNLYKVNSVTGNSRGYRLSVQDLEESIPVSRELAKEILVLLEELNQPAYAL